MKPDALNSPLVRFIGSDVGPWRIENVAALAGEPLAPAKALDIRYGDFKHTAADWILSGAISNVRYTTRDEIERLNAKQAAPGRSEATRGALIPIRKSAAWWAMAQDERRAVYEERSRHTTIGLEYLPQIARKLHHSRDLGEPFDFLTWFEFAPEHEAAFDDLLARLRNSEEWAYVEREIEIRVRRIS